MTPAYGRRFAGEGARGTNDAAGRAASLKTQGPSTPPEIRKRIIRLRSG